jgi:hypothetical protein
MPLSILRRGARRPATHELAALSTFRQELEGVVTRICTIRDEWVRLCNLERDRERLANAAAVFRWELARLAPRLGEVSAPEIASTLHRDFQDALSRTARGCQLLATGYRSHNSESVCDGQSLLLESADLVERLVRQLDEMVSASDARSAC